MLTDIIDLIPKVYDKIRDDNKLAPFEYHKPKLYLEEL